MLKLLPKSLPAGQVNEAYLAQLAAPSAVGLATFRLLDGEFPVGLRLGANGCLWGVPGRVGISVAMIEARDERGGVWVRQYTIAVNDGVAVGTGLRPWPLGAMAAVRENAAAGSAGKTLPEVEVAGAG